MKPNSAISTAKRDDEHPRHDFQLESPKFPGGVTEGGGCVRGMHDRPLKKTTNFFQVETGHIFVLEYTEGE